MKDKIKIIPSNKFQLITADLSIKETIKILSSPQCHEVIVLKDTHLPEASYFAFNKFNLDELLKQYQDNKTLVNFIDTNNSIQANTCTHDILEASVDKYTVVLQHNDVVGIIFKLESDNFILSGDAHTGSGNFNKHPPSIGLNVYNIGISEALYFSDSMPGGPPPASIDPPRTAYALLDFPSAIQVNIEIELVLGLSSNPSKGVSGKQLRRPDSSLGSYTLKIELIHDGFSLRDSESDIQKLWVTSEDPYPQVKLHLTALDDTIYTNDRILLAYFFIDHQMIGSAARTTRVKNTDAISSSSISEEKIIAGEIPVGIDNSIITSQQAPDLTITIAKDNTIRGHLLWHLDSKHINLDLENKIKAIDIGLSPNEFANKIMHAVNLRGNTQDTEDLYDFLKGTGIEIASKIPIEVKNVIKELAGKIKLDPPTILIVTQEPYIPWELAYFDLGKRNKCFFTAEFIVGRWILSDTNNSDGQASPSFPPLSKLDIDDIIVISGNYENTPYFNRLLEAEKEAQTITTQYNAVAVNASLKEIKTHLKNGPDADLIHFAVHGKYDKNGLKDGIATVDGKMLVPTIIRSINFTRTPFIFLNACQVGQGNEVLENYAGVANAFLSAGAAAVIAPLFSINDKEARIIAETFYENIKKGETPGEILRKLRSQFYEGNPKLSSTMIAYQFFGHPSLNLNFIN